MTEPTSDAPPPSSPPPSSETPPLTPPPLTPPPVAVPTKDERTWGMFAHLAALLGFLVGGLGFLGPLVVWLVKKDESAYVDHHGKESLNFQITALIANVATFVLGILTCGIGWVLFAAVFVVEVVLTIVAGIAANDGVRYRYPVSIRFIR